MMLSIRSLLALGRNAIEGMTIKFEPLGVGLSLTGKDIFDIYENDVVVQSCVSTTFIGRRIFWEDLQRELHFVQPPSNRRKVAIDAARLAESAVQDCHDQIRGSDHAALKLSEIFLVLRHRVEEGRQAIEEVRDVQEYNDWVLETGGGADEKMSYDEQLADFQKAITTLRTRSYPIWRILIDLMQETQVRVEAEDKFIAGCKSIGKDTSEMHPSLVPV